MPRRRCPTTPGTPRRDPDHLLRVAGKPRVGPSSTWPASCSNAHSARGWTSPVRGLVEAHPLVGGTGGGLALTVRDGVDGFITDDDEATAAHARRAGPRPGAGRGDGPRRPRARARAVPRDRGGGARAARAGGAALRASPPPAIRGRRSVPWSAVRSPPDGNPLELPDGATGADAAARSARAWPGRRSASA